jgi:hypothetical protein
MSEGIEAVLEHAATVVIGNKDTDIRGVPDRLRAGRG